MVSAKNCSKMEIYILASSKMASSKEMEYWGIPQRKIGFQDFLKKEI